jgi:hypothetical protein
MFRRVEDLRNDAFRFRVLMDVEENRDFLRFSQVVEICVKSVLRPVSGGFCFSEVLEELRNEEERLNFFILEAKKSILETFEKFSSADHQVSQLLKIYHLLESEPDTEKLRKISKELKTSLSTPNYSSLPPSVEISEIMEGEGTSDQKQVYSPFTESKSIQSFDMESLKNSLKKPSTKILYKQISTSGQVKISEVPSSQAPSIFLPQLEVKSSFKDFLCFPRGPAVTLEALGENSDDSL